MAGFEFPQRTEPDSNWKRCALDKVGAAVPRDSFARSPAPTTEDKGFLLRVAFTVVGSSKQQVCNGFLAPITRLMEGPNKYFKNDCSLRYDLALVIIGLPLCSVPQFRLLLTRCSQYIALGLCVHMFKEGAIVTYRMRCKEYVEDTRRLDANVCERKAAQISTARRTPVYSLRPLAHGGRGAATSAVCYHASLIDAATTPALPP